MVIESKHVYRAIMFDSNMRTYALLDPRRAICVTLIITVQRQVHRNVARRIRLVLIINSSKESPLHFRGQYHSFVADEHLQAAPASRWISVSRVSRPCAINARCISRNSTLGRFSPSSAASAATSSVGAVSSRSCCTFATRPALCFVST
jgi:hypothetical protein